MPIENANAYKSLVETKKTIGDLVTLSLYEGIVLNPGALQVVSIRPLGNSEGSTPGVRVFESVFTINEVKYEMRIQFDTNRNRVIRHAIIFDPLSPFAAPTKFEMFRPGTVRDGETGAAIEGLSFKREFLAHTVQLFPLTTANIALARYFEPAIKNQMSDVFLVAGGHREGVIEPALMASFANFWSVVESLGAKYMVPTELFMYVLTLDRPSQHAVAEALANVVQEWTQHPTETPLEKLQAALDHLQIPELLAMPERLHTDPNATFESAAGRRIRNFPERVFEGLDVDSAAEMAVDLGADPFAHLAARAAADGVDEWRTGQQDERDRHAREGRHGN